MNLLACILIFAMILYLVYNFFLKKEISNKKIVLIISVISISIMILCLNMKPPESFDLYRYFLEMDYLRNLDLKTTFTEILARPTKVWTAIQRIATLISKDNHAIFFLSIPITVISYMYILVDLNKNYKLTNRQIVLSIFTFFSIVSTIHLMSGIRNVLAVAIYSIGMYLALFKKKKLGYLFYLVALLIHPMVIMILCFQIISKLLRKIVIGNVKIGQYIILLWQVFSGFIIYVLKVILYIIPIALIELYINKFEMEINYKMTVDYRVLIPELIQIILFTLLMHKTIKNSEKVDNRLLIFYYLGFFIIGSFTMFNIFIRTRFIFAYFLPFILGYKNTTLTDGAQNYAKKINIIEYLLLGISIYINVYYIYFMYSNAVFIRN